MTTTPSAPADLTIPDILTKTADLLDAEGWGQHVNKDYATGKRCIYGATLFVASEGRSEEPPLGTTHRQTVEDEQRAGEAIFHLARYLLQAGELPPEVTPTSLYGGYAIDWNDAQRRTQTEVTAALRAAAAWTQPETEPTDDAR